MNVLKANDTFLAFFKEFLITLFKKDDNVLKLFEILRPCKLSKVQTAGAI